MPILDVPGLLGQSVSHKYLIISRNSGKSASSAANRGTDETWTKRSLQGLEALLAPHFANDPSSELRGAECLVPPLVPLFIEVVTAPVGPAMNQFSARPKFSA